MWHRARPLGSRRRRHDRTGHRAGPFDAGCGRGGGLERGETGPELRAVRREARQDAKRVRGVGDPPLALPELREERPVRDARRRSVRGFGDLDQLRKEVLVQLQRLGERLEDRERLLRLAASHRAVRERDRRRQRLGSRSRGRVDADGRREDVLVVGLDGLRLADERLGLLLVAGGEGGLGREEEERHGPRRGLERLREVGARLSDLSRLEQHRDEAPEYLAVVRPDPERLLVDLLRLVGGPPLAQEAGDDGVFLQRLARPPRLRVQVGQLHVKLDVLRLGLDHLLVDADGPDDVLVLGVVVREDLVLALRLDRQALLRVELGEALVDVEARGVELVDLLVDRDRLQEEAVARIVLGDPGEVGDRLFVPVQADEEVSDLVQDVDVAR